MDIEQLAAAISAIPVSSQKYLAKCRIDDLKKKMVVKQFVPSNITQVKIAETVLDIPSLVEFYNSSKEDTHTVSVVISQNTRENAYTTELKYPDHLPGSYVVEWTRTPTETEYAEQKTNYEKKVLVEQEQIQQQIKKFEKFIEEAV